MPKIAGLIDTATPEGRAIAHDAIMQMRGGKRRRAGSGTPNAAGSTASQRELPAPRASKPSRKPRQSKPVPAQAVVETRTMELVLPLPPSTNRYWRTRVAKRGDGKSYVQTYLSEDAKAFKAQVGEIAAHARCKPLEGDVLLCIKIYRPLKSGDVSNRIKVLEDALNGFAYHDDKQVAGVIIFRDDTDRKNPRAEVVVKPFRAVSTSNIGSEDL